MYNQINVNVNVGNISGHLRGRMPKLAVAEAKAKAKQGCELIYKLGATLNGNGPPKLYLGPLALLSLDTPSLTPPCYNVTLGIKWSGWWSNFRWI